MAAIASVADREQWLRSRVWPIAINGCDRECGRSPSMAAIASVADREQMAAIANVADCKKDGRGRGRLTGRPVTKKDAQGQKWGRRGEKRAQGPSHLEKLIGAAAPIP